MSLRRTWERPLASTLALALFAMGAVGSVPQKRANAPESDTGTTSEATSGWTPSCPTAMNGGGTHTATVNTLNDLNNAIVSYCFSTLTEAHVIYPGGSPSSQTLKGIRAFAAKEKLTAANLDAIAAHAFGEKSCPKFMTGLAHDVFCKRQDNELDYDGSARQRSSFERALGREGAFYRGFLLESQRVAVRSIWWSNGGQNVTERLGSLLLWRDLDRKKFAFDLQESVKGDPYLAMLAPKVVQAYEAAFAKFERDEAQHVLEAEERVKGFHAAVAKNKEAWNFFYELELGENTETCRDRLYALFAAHVRSLSNDGTKGTITDKLIDDYGVALARAGRVCKEKASVLNAMNFVVESSVHVPRTDMDAWLDRPSVSANSTHVVQIGGEEHEVASVRTEGDHASVSFKPQRWAEDVSNCVTTNRVTAIHRDGTLEYEEVCSVVGKEWHSRQEPPLDVRSDVGAALKPGIRVLLSRHHEAIPMRTIVDAWAPAKQPKSLVVYNVALQ